MDPSIDSSSNDTIKNKNTTISSPNSVKAQGYIEKSESEYQSEALEQAFQTILNSVHPNPRLPELLKTPARAAKAFTFLTEGYLLDPYIIAKDALFEAYDSNIVVIKNLTLNSMCEHHLLPFVGRCDIGYIPSEKILGLSKFSRIVDVFARRLQVQERLTFEIANFLNDLLKPKGVIVKISSKHMCAQIRGVEECNSWMETMSTLGDFKTNTAIITQFLTMIEKC